jgi:putative transcriptional regulator
MMAKRKMSLTELTARMDMTMASLSIIKTNKALGVRFATLAKLCEVLECLPGDLLELVDDETYNKLMGDERSDP